MGEGVLLLLVLLLLVVVLGTKQNTAYGQGRYVPQGRIRGPRDAGLPNATSNGVPLPRMRPGGNLICYSCKLDFRKKKYERDNPCLGRHGNLRVSEDYAVNCGPNDTYCRVERMEVNGVLTMLRRECTDTCFKGCRLRGFGINNEVCEMCCSQDRCNDKYPYSGAAGIVTASRVTLTAAATAAASVSSIFAFSSSGVKLGLDSAMFVRVLVWCLCVLVCVPVFPPCLLLW